MRLGGQLRHFDDHLFGHAGNLKAFSASLHDNGFQRHELFQQRPEPEFVALSGFSLESAFGCQRRKSKLVFGRYAFGFEKGSADMAIVSSQKCAYGCMAKPKVPDRLRLKSQRITN
jgi:hypothetical protein